MDWDEARLLPAALTLGVSGIAGLMLALGAALAVNPLAPLVLVVALVLLAASRLIEPGRRWALALGSRAAVAGIVIWLGVAAATHDADRPVQAVFSLAFAGCSLWVARFLHAETLPPPWASWDWEAGSAPAPHDERYGWIEELPAPRSGAMETPGGTQTRAQNQRLVTTFFEV